MKKRKIRNWEYRAFKLWIAKLGYTVIPMKGDGFFYHFGAEKGYMTDDYRFSRGAKKLMKEFLSYD